MAAEPKSGKLAVEACKHGTSPSSKPQLFPPQGVQTDVGTVAMDPGLLAMTSVPSRSPVEAEASVSAGGVNDAEVMLRVKAGDESAFDYLLQKYRRPMVSFMYRMTRNPAVAEDLAQEVFLRVYRSRESYEPEAMVSLDEPDGETGRTVDVPDDALTAEESIVRRERLQAIRARVQALPERQRIAVIMHKYQQMDYRQIAEVLKLSESATKSLLFRAYETLRTQLKEFV